MPPNFAILYPGSNETKESYRQRLVDDGHVEMFIRKALAWHYNMHISEMTAFFNNFELARLRHITMLAETHPNRTDYSLIKKVVKNLGLTDERATELIKRFRNTHPDKLEYMR